MKKYTKKVAVTLTEDDYNALETIVGNSRLTIGQLASTMVEEALAANKGAVSHVTEVADVA